VDPLGEAGGRVPRLGAVAPALLDEEPDVAWPKAGTIKIAATATTIPVCGIEEPFALQLFTIMAQHAWNICKRRTGTVRYATVTDAACGLLEYVRIRLTMNKIPFLVVSLASLLNFGCSEPPPAPVKKEAAKRRKPSPGHPSLPDVPGGTRQVFRPIRRF